MVFVFVFVIVIVFVFVFVFILSKLDDFKLFCIFVAEL